MQGSILVKIVMILAQVVIFSVMLSMGLNLALRQLTSLWRKPGMLLRALLAVDFLVPLAAVLLVLLLDLPKPIAIAIVLMAIAPGAPFTTRKAAKAEGSFPFAASVQTTVSLLAVITVPLSLAILSSIFEATAQASPLRVATQVAMVQFLPLAIGLAISHWWPKVAQTLGKYLTKIGNILLAVLVLLALVIAVKILASMALLSILAMAIMIVFSLAVGHVLGGPEPGTRTSLALASATRNFGLAVMIATLNFPGQGVLPGIVAYLIVGAVLGMPYMIWRKRSAKEAAVGS